MEKQETEEILYSLTESPMWTEIRKKEIVKLQRVANKKERKSPYDLLNWATIKPNGTIRQCSHDYYDTQFKKELNQMHNAKMELFLDHHFEQATNKAGLIKRIEENVLCEHRVSIMDVLLKDEKIEIVAEWIRDKKKELPKVNREKESKPKELRDCFHSEEDFNNATTAFKKSIQLNKDGKLTISTKGLAVRAAWHTFSSKMNLKCQSMSVFVKLFAKEFGYILKDGKNTGGKTPTSKQYKEYLSKIESAYSKIKGEVKKK